MSYTITVPSGTTVYYTTDGTAPSNANGNTITANTTKTISATTTVKAIAYLTGYDNKSSVVTGVYTKNAAAANVTYSPNGGTFYNATNVTLTSSSGSYVYYGINANPGSSYVTSGGSIPLDGGTNGQVVIKAIGKAGTTGYSDGTQNSSSTYTFKCGTPTITGAANGGSYVADSKTVTIAAPSSNATTGATYQYSTDGTNWTTGTSCTVSGLGSHTVYARAIKTNYQNSDTYSITFTLRKPAAPTISGTSPFDNSTTVTMAAGADGGTIYYTSGSSAPADPTSSSTAYSSGIGISSTTYFKAICVVNGVASDVTSATFTRSAALAAPTITPVSNTYDNDLTATISAASGATIYYRVNGGAWQTYSSGISVTADNTTIEAYATKAGNSDSSTASATYNLKCATPTLYVGGGTYNSAQTVTITSATSGATIYYSTGSGFTTLANGGSITISESCSLSVYATKSNYQDSESYGTSYVINAEPTGTVSSLALAYSPVIGTSDNNSDRDLARFDGSVSFTAAPATSNGWTLDHYVVTVSDGTNFATTAAGAAINGISLDAAATSLAALNFKVGSTYTASVTAVYSKSGSTYSTSAVTTSAELTYATYAPSITATTYVEPHQAHDIWWEQTGESHRYYFDVYRVEIKIDDNPTYNPATSIPVSYYQLKRSKDHGATWENVTDRTVNMAAYGTTATTYPTGQYGGSSDSKYAGRFNGNYRFTTNQTAGTDGNISLMYYWAVDVTSAYSPTSVTDPTQENPAEWLYRIEAVYGGSETVNVAGTDVTPTSVNISSSDYTDYVPATNDPVITGVDNVGNDIDGVKEVQYYDLKGVRLLEAPATGIYIEVRLMNNGQVVTSKRLAR